MKKVSWLLIVVLVLGLFSGCTGTSKQARAIEDLLADYGGYHLVADDVKQQIADQSKDSDKNATMYSYSVKVKVPDLSKLKADDLKVSVPAIEWNDPNTTEFKEDAAEAVKTAALAHLEETEAEKFSEVTVDVTVKKGEEGQWTAQFAQGGPADLYQADDKVVAYLLDIHSNVQGRCGRLDIADRR